MANDADIQEVKARMLDIEKYAGECFNKLARYPDADRHWLLSRADNLEIMVNKLRLACAKAAEGK